MSDDGPALRVRWWVSVTKTADHSKPVARASCSECRWVGPIRARLRNARRDLALHPPHPILEPTA